MKKVLTLLGGHPAWGLAVSYVERIDTHLTVLFSFRR